MSAYPKAETRQDAVRATTAEVTAKLDAAAVQSVLKHALDGRKISARLAELERESDLDRTLMTNGSIVALLGLLLAATLSTSWLLLVAFSLLVLLLHSLEVHCPPLGFLRQLGLRTRREIERERYALKLLRGDFDRAVQSQGRERAEHAINAVWR